MLGKIEKGEGTERGWLDGITDSMDMSLNKLQFDLEGKGSLLCCSSWSCKESDMI